MIITGCGNNYQTIKKLGAGSFGTVYQVRDTTTNIDYALKIISKQLIAQYDANAMIQNEIAIHYTCNHKNIVRLYSYWEDSNSIYLLLEYCSKGHLILPKTQFNDDDVFQVFHQILNGVDYLHQYNIIHRDLKFENILIHEDGTLKLCDFGWAVKVQQLPIQNVMCGTTEYMPPEVVSKYVLDFKLDCWSLGVILYALVHGKFPFDASNQQELIKNILFNQLTIPKRSGIEDDLINLIQALLIKNAQLRPTIQQIYLCKWMKQNMKKNNLFNHYENEALKQKVKSKNIQLKIVQNQDKQFFTPKKMVNSCMTQDDFDNHHKSIRAPLTCAKLNNSSRTISISTNPSPQTNQQSQIERFFNFLEQKTKLL